MSKEYLESSHDQPKVTLCKLDMSKETVLVSSDKKTNFHNACNVEDLCLPIVTESMIMEEKLLCVENEKETENLKQLAIKKFQEISSEVRFSQLNHLLEKSNIYANYLLGIIETNKKREERKTKKKKKTAEIKSKFSKVINKQRSKRMSSSSLLPAKKRILDTNVYAKAYFQVGDEVSIMKTNKDGEEELLTVKILDSCFKSSEWLYQVKPLRSKMKEWVKECDIFADNIDNDYVSIESSMLQSKMKKIDRDLLIQTKLHTGCNVAGHCKIVDGERLFSGQKVPNAQPELLTGGILRNYQVTGYQWLKVLFDNAVNGILADEMGLGKTVQCIAMICRLIKSGFPGPFLVCAPLSTVSNWVLEFKKFAPRVPVLLYHGNQSERCALSTCISQPVADLNCSPVVVTSYEILMRDRRILTKFSWDYLIVDEGHRIKNINCRLLKELKALTVTAKVLLTGTPLQNNLVELWSLLNFLLPEVFNDLNSFEAWFDLGQIQNSAKVICSEKEEQIVVMLHKILAPFLLRRTKSDLEIELPPKRELLVFVPLTEHQASFYKAIANRTIRKLLYKKDDATTNAANVMSFASVASTSDGTGNVAEALFTSRRLTRKSTLKLRLSQEKENCMQDNSDSIINVSVNNLMMEMRKCCNHPYLIKYPLIPGTNIFRVDEELITSCGKMQLLDRMLPMLHGGGHKVLIFSQMTKVLDVLQDYCNFRNLKYFRLDGMTKCEDRQVYIDLFNSQTDSFLFLLSTKAGGLGINLTAADTVIIYDSDWNPQNDLQAQDRCHRIGQNRPVIIYRLVAAHTVDQFMVERAEAKRVLERLVINDSKFKGRLAEDLKCNSLRSVQSTTLLTMLKKFRTDYACQKQISEEELKRIIDRKFVMSCSDSDLSCGVFQMIE